MAAVTDPLLSLPWPDWLGDSSAEHSHSPIPPQREGAGAGGAAGKGWAPDWVMGQIFAACLRWKNPSGPSPTLPCPTQSQAPLSYTRKGLGTGRVVFQPGGVGEWLPQHDGPLSPSLECHLAP